MLCASRRLQRIAHLHLDSSSSESTADDDAAAQATNVLSEAPRQGWLQKALAKVPGLPDAVRVPLRRVVYSLAFEVFAMTVVVVNAILLSLDHYDMTSAELVSVQSGVVVLTTAVRTDTRFGCRIRCVSVTMC